MAIVVNLPPLIEGNDQFLFKKPLAFSNVEEMTDALMHDFGLKPNDYYLHRLTRDNFSEGTFYKIRLRLLGGKGGFGSQLRAQGNKMSSKKRAGDYESCRDLSGQRIRTQKHARLIEEYLSKEPERLSQRDREIREKMQKYLDAPNRKMMFNDPEYLKELRKIVDSTEEALHQGLLEILNSDSEEEEDEGVDLETESERIKTDDEDENRDEDEDGKDESETGDEDGKDSSGTEDEDEKAPIRNSRVPRNLTSMCLDKYLSSKSK